MLQGDDCIIIIHFKRYSCVTLFSHNLVKIRGGGAAGNGLWSWISYTKSYFGTSSRFGPSDSQIKMPMWPLSPVTSTPSTGCNGKPRTLSGQCCSIPFTYKGEEYNSCIEVEHNRPWCSLDPVYKPKWGHCGKFWWSDSLSILTMSFTVF